MIEDVEIWYLKADPEYPNAKFSKTNPTWELEIRAYEKSDFDYLVSLGLYPKPVRDPETDVRQYWRVKLKRKEWKHDKKTTPPTITRNAAPEITLGNGEPVDPNTVGNGSRANIRIFQYTFKDEETNKDQIVSVLMAAQIILYKVYKPKKRDDFKVVETQIVPLAEDDPDANAEEVIDPSDYDDPHDHEGPEPGDDDAAGPTNEPLGEDDIPEEIRRPTTPARAAPAPVRTAAPARTATPSPATATAPRRATSPSPRLTPGTKPRGF
jgi:hypothetical protein